MNTNLKIKIPVKTLLVKLRAKRQELEVAVTKVPSETVAENQYREETKTWNKAVLKKLGIPCKENFRVNTSCNEVTIWTGMKPSDFTNPPQKRNSETYHLKHSIQEIDSLLRILEMTQEEFINTSKFDSISRFL